MKKKKKSIVPSFLNPISSAIISFWDFLGLFYYLRIFLSTSYLAFFLSYTRLKSISWFKKFWNHIKSQYSRKINWIPGMPYVLFLTNRKYFHTGLLCHEKEPVFLWEVSTKCLVQRNAKCTTTMHLWNCFQFSWCW